MTFIQNKKQFDDRFYPGGWHNLKVSDYNVDSVSSSYPNWGLINCPFYNPLTRHSLGDRIRLKQTGDSSYRYFYITNLTATQIKVVGDRTNALQDLAITEMGISKDNAPGFPEWLNVRCTLDAEDLTIDVSYVDCKVIMIDNLVKLYGETIGATVSAAGTPNTLKMFLPVAKTNHYPLRNAGYFEGMIGGVNGAAYTLQYYDTVYIIVNVLPDMMIPNGDLSIYWQWEYILTNE